MHGLIEVHTGSRIPITSNIWENFRKFPPRTKFPENLQPYALHYTSQNVSSLTYSKIHNLLQL